MSPPAASPRASGAGWDRILSRLPARTEARLRAAGACLLPLAALRIPVARLHGETRGTGRPASMLVAGSPHWTRYLTDRFFAGTPRREAIGHATVWQLPGCLRRLRASADVTVARVDRLSARLLFDDGYLRVPDWVGARLPLPVDVAALARTSGSIAEDWRKTRVGGWSAELMQAPADFDAFYERMYVPYTLARHGADAYVKGYHHLRRAFRHGGLLRLSRDGVPVAGAVFEQVGATLVLEALGVAGDGMALRQQGAVAALYVHAIGHAQRHGCTAIDLRGSRPSLADGLLRYKAKWGATIYDKRDDPHLSLLHWHRLDGAVAELLAHTPLVARDRDGLTAVGFDERSLPWTAAELQRLHDRLWIPGLARLGVVTPAPLPDGQRLPPGLRLVAHTRVRDGGPRALLAQLAAD